MSCEDDEEQEIAAKTMMADSLKERLRIAPIVTLDHHQVREGATIRQMMVERAEALARIEALETEVLGERALSSAYANDLGKLHERIATLEAEIATLVDVRDAGFKTEDALRKKWFEAEAENKRLREALELIAEPMAHDAQTIARAALSGDPE